MERRDIKKFLKVIPAAFVLSTSLVVSPLYSLAASDPSDRPNPQGQEIPANTLQKGLISYYFNDGNFRNISLVTTQTTGELSSLSSEIKPLLDTNNNGDRFQSAYIEGHIKIDESQMYQFTTSADKFVKLWIDGVQVIDRGEGDSMYKYKQRVYLEKDKVYNIKVEYQNPHQTNRDVDLTLYWIKGNDLSGTNRKVIPEDYLFSPELGLKTNNQNSVKHSRAARSIADSEKQQAQKNDKLEDIDGDGIPDTIETNGYTVTVHNGKPHIIAWSALSEDSRKKLTKYLSSPMKWSTASDPYSDFQKVTGRIDKQVKHEARNPLVAAYPIVSVDMEQIVLSKNQTLSFNEGGSKSNTVSRSTSTSKTDSISASVSAEVSASLSDFGVKVSTSFSTEDSSTVAIDNSTSDTSESNWSKTIGINTGDAAYFAAGIRYNNQGTAPIYTAKPTNTFSLMNNQSIVTVTAKENQLANVVKPGEYYPIKGKSPILLNAKDDFGSSPITLNFNQLNFLEKEKKLKIDTDQVSGKVGIVQANGEVIADRDRDWSTYIPQIEETSARIIMNDYMDEKPIERRVAAIDPQDATEQTKPEVTLKEALKLVFPDINEQDGKSFYKGQSLKDNFELVLDTNTANNVANQLKSMTDKDIYNMKLNAKMNIMVKKKDSGIESILVPTIKPGELDLNSNAVKYEIIPNPKAPSDILYILKERDSSLNTEESKVVSSGINSTFQLHLSNKKDYSLIVRLPNGQEFLVFDKLSDTLIQLDINNLFSQYQRGKGLSNEVTQATIDKVQTKLNTAKDSSLKRELQTRINEAQMLLNLKPSSVLCFSDNGFSDEKLKFLYTMILNPKAPSNIMYRLSDLSKQENESWINLDQNGVGSDSRFQTNPSKIKQFELVAQLPNGQQYVIYEQK
ncbi:hypothetical protein CN271_14405 [Bacillus cereus]|uniref:binary toxin-like calcium binding domain-containing protein n=1 Tax=Bacillus cereus TaxID=1396 RepID=UPI000BEE7A55|nr:binary toxin-like calcium binding domain-containing protein [Bacillus cereus]PEE32811.1 hypothetical protein CON59_28965 [Bacillus cereus]PET49835.1 hypothetical protein CN523_07230 [Bacillus cereus]PEV74217.1 hypothetical protein CN429_25090 [Bacillus cereus]PFA55276.1 hypothetical protein CN389_16200 [Bacillus cereus]PFD71941.1 hypothetical protein CN271_14405 [Bacillus cereus]